MGKKDKTSKKGKMGKAVQMAEMGGKVGSGKIGFFFILISYSWFKRLILSCLSKWLT